MLSNKNLAILKLQNVYLFGDIVFVLKLSHDCTTYPNYSFYLCRGFAFVTKESSSNNETSTYQVNCRKE